MALASSLLLWVEARLAEATELTLTDMGGGLAVLYQVGLVCELLLHGRLAHLG